MKTLTWQALPWFAPLPLKTHRYGENYCIFSTTGQHVRFTAYDGQLLTRWPITADRISAGCRRHPADNPLHYSMGQPPAVYLVLGIAQAINEAIASNSRGPVQEVAASLSVHWLILHLPIPFDKLASLMEKQLIMTGTERNQIPSLRIYGDIEGCKVTAVDLCEQHAIDIDIWGKIKMGSWRKGTSHCCAECGAQGPNGSTISTWNLYCVNCWAGHFSKRHRA